MNREEKNIKCSFIEENMWRREQAERVFDILVSHDCDILERYTVKGKYWEIFQRWEDFVQDLIDEITSIYLWDVLDYLDRHAKDKFYKWKVWKKPFFDGTVTSNQNWVHTVVCENISPELLKVLYRLREHKRLPIRDQTDECIDFIYSLVK